MREATNKFARDVMGAVIENRDDGASRIERDGQSWFRVAVTPKTIMTSLGPVTLPASALPQRRERGIAGAGRREPGPRRRLPDASGGRARSADDGSLHGPGSGGVLCEDRRHDAVGEHPAAPDPEHARMLGEPRPGTLGSIRKAEGIPQDATTASVSLDGVMVPLRPGEDGRAEASWREAACGTVSFARCRRAPSARDR